MHIAIEGSRLSVDFKQILDVYKQLLKIWGGVPGRPYTSAWNWNPEVIIVLTCSDFPAPACSYCLSFVLPLFLSLSALLCQVVV